MEETKGQSFKTLLYGYTHVIRQILKTKETLFILSIMIIMNIQGTIFGSFWAINATDRIKIPMALISGFPFIKSIIMMIFYFVIVPRIHIERYRKPLLAGFGALMVSTSLVVLAGEKSFYLIIISALIEAGSLSLIQPLMDSLQVTLVDPKERARIIGVLFTVVLTFSAPFGWIGGILSSYDRRLPFVMVILFLIGGFILTLKQKETVKA